MRFTTLLNYYLIDWLCDANFCLFTCWFDSRILLQLFDTLETVELELASTIILVLQAELLQSFDWVIALSGKIVFHIVSATGNIVFCICQCHLKFSMEPEKDMQSL